MKVSVLMITYNHEKFIAQAIDSVLAQKVDFDYELVIGEDCSTDTTRQIILDYQQQYPDKIKLLLPEHNLGMLKNFTNTYKACQGQYIALLEGDDYWTSPNKLAKQVNFLDRNLDFSICFNDTIIIEEDSNCTPQLFPHRSSGKSLKIQDLLAHNFISTPSVMYRSGLVEDFPDWFYEQSMGDWTLHIFHAQHGKIGYIDEVMSAYRVHADGVWSSKSVENKLKSTIKMLKGLAKHFGDEYSVELTHSIANHTQGLANLSSIKKERSRLINQSESHKIHIGCGTVRFEGWINLDIESDNPMADVICDAREELPFENNSCSLVYNEHFLEHLTVEEGVSFLKECHRVLEPGGILRISMPSLEYIIDKYSSENWRDQDWLTWKDFEFVKTRAEMINISFRWWEHKWLYDQEELTRRLSEAGYVNIRQMEWGESNITELQNRETRKDSLLIFEAEAAQIVAIEAKVLSTPLVSVCIPTYNGEKFLAETLNSVLCQTYPNLEIIISDDNSQDNTIEIANSFKDKSSAEFSVLEHEQYGLSQNWNFCISQAKGKYIKFVFQDDLLEPNAIAEMVELAEQDEEIGLVFSPRTLFATHGDKHYDSSFLESHGAKDIHQGWSKLQAIQSGQDLLKDPHLFNYSINKIGEPTTVLIKKEMFNRVGLFNSDLCQLVDLEMWLRIISDCKVGFVNKYLSHFRLHQDQQTSQNAAKEGLISLDYQRFFHIIYSNSDYPDSAREIAFYRYVFFTRKRGYFSQLRMSLAQELLSIPDDNLQDVYQGLVKETHQIMILFRPTQFNNFDEEEQKLIDVVTEKSGTLKVVQNLLVSMMYGRADRLSLPYDLSQIPEWFIRDYLKFLFPSSFSFHKLDESTDYSNYLRKWVEYIHTSAFNNSNDSFWKKVVSELTQVANFIPSYFNEENLKDIYIKRAEITKLYLQTNSCEVDYDFPERSTSRRKIRLGILAAHFIPSAETFAALPVYEYLSREFEVVLYSLEQTNHPLEHYCSSSADHFVHLPKNLSEQVNVIRADDLDILFVATNVTAVTNQICLLATHRLARIQITSGGSVTTTGMRNMDYFLSGSLTDPAQSAQDQYQEKLIKLPGAAHCFSYGNDDTKSTVEIDRAILDIHEDTIIFTSGANFYKITPELIHTWAKIIAQVPNSVLMLFPFGPNWSSGYPTVSFEKHLGEVFAEYGVSADRIIALDPKPVPNREDIKEYFKVADVYLDSYPFAGTTSLLEPLLISLPVVARQGNSFRSAMGAAMIQSLDIDDLVADSEESYIQLAVELGNNPELRQRKRCEIEAKMRDNPSFLDSRGYSVKIGNLFRELFDKYNTDALSQSLRLSDVNLMVFPDWNQSEDAVGMELQQVIQALATQSGDRQTTLLIDTTNIAIEDAEMFLSSVTMNLMMEEDLDITEELEISLIEDLNDIQWATLMPSINARIVMECDNQAAVGKLSLTKLSQLDLESFMQSQVLVSN